MKHLIIAIIVFGFFTSTATAQISITSADMPKANNGMMRKVVNPVGLTYDFTTTGANYTWDFSGLVAADSQLQKYDTISNAPIFAQFIFGPFGASQNRSHIFGSTTNPLNFPSGFQNFFAVDSAYAYYKSNTNVFAKTGFSLKLNGIDVPLPYDTFDAIYKFPLNFGDVDSSKSRFKINTPFLSFLYYEQDQKRKSFADGWGTLKLPLIGSFDVLRQKSIVNISDTVHIDTGFVNIGFRLPRPAEVEYKWLAKGKGEPVLSVTGTEVAGTFVPSRITFLETPYPNAINKQNTNAINISHLGNTVYITSQANITQVEVYNLSGQLISQYYPSGNKFSFIQHGFVLVVATDEKGQRHVKKINLQ